MVGDVLYIGEEVVCIDWCVMVLGYGVIVVVGG